jgi:hypothetical protein
MGSAAEGKLLVAGSGSGFDLDFTGWKINPLGNAFPGIPSIDRVVRRDDDWISC